MTTDETRQPDEIDKLIAADPNAHMVEGQSQVWLLSGDDQFKLARDLVATQRKQSQ
jgi:hypothetical protein